MQKVALYIETPRNSQTVSLEDELSIGRTGEATIALDDVGLSRVNTTIYRDGDIVYAVDEGSLNGTFLNGQRLEATPERLLDGDVLTLGSETKVRIEISQTGTAAAGSRKPETASQKPTIETPAANPRSQIPNPKSQKPPMILILAAGSAFFIVFISLFGILLINWKEKEPKPGGSKTTSRQNINLTIPIRVVDPLGGGQIEDLDELAEAWEVQDAAFKAEDLEEVKVSTDAPQLTVTVADWQKQRDLAMAPRKDKVGLVSGVIIPSELSEGGIRKQLSIFPKYGITRQTLPRDYVSLAQKRMSNELIELPLATELYYLDNIGTSADSSPFMLFDINSNTKSLLSLNSEGMTILQRLAENFSGQRYNLDNPTDRLQMKRRLLRMFHPEAKPILEEIARAYHQKFGRPLKITSLTRSLEYQYDLSKATSNAYRGATPPHSTGRTFDMAYMHMTKDEQNFVMAEIAKLEKAGKVDALHERGQTPCIHIFVFPQSAVAKLN